MVLGQAVDGRGEQQAEGKQQQPNDCITVLLPLSLPTPTAVQLENKALHLSRTTLEWKYDKVENDSVPHSQLWSIVRVFRALLPTAPVSLSSMLPALRVLPADPVMWHRS